MSHQSGLEALKYIAETSGDPDEIAAAAHFLDRLNNAESRQPAPNTMAAIRALADSNAELEEAESEIRRHHALIEELRTACERLLWHTSHGEDEPRLVPDYRIVLLDDLNALRRILNRKVG